MPSAPLLQLLSFSGHGEAFLSELLKRTARERRHLALGKVPGQLAESAGHDGHPTPWRASLF